MVHETLAMEEIQELVMWLDLDEMIELLEWLEAQVEAERERYNE